MSKHYVSGHHITKCKTCKRVISQCRCIKCDKTEYWDICDTCEEREKESYLELRIAEFTCKCGHIIHYNMQQGFGDFDANLREVHQICPKCKAEYLYMDRLGNWRWLDANEPHAIRKTWDNPPAWDFYLWCPECDMRQQHSVSGHVAECCVCGEPHEISREEDVIIYAATGKSALKETKDA